MSSADIYQELRSGARQLLLSLTGLPAVAWEGVSYTPAIGTPYVREQIVPVADQPVSNGVIAHTVLYVLTLFYPSGGGSLDIEKMAGQLLDLYKVGTRFSYAGSDVLCQKAERKGVMVDGDWISVPVRVTMIAFTPD